MGHYIGPKARVNRRLGLTIYDSRGAERASHKRPTPPGQQTGRRRRPTDYGKALMEKQKIRHYYGLSQRQLDRFFQIANRLPGNTGEHLLVLCERRLDNVVWKAGFARTRTQARQFVAHGHLEVNGRRAKVPSTFVEAGDTIRVRKRDSLEKVYQTIAHEVDRPECGFLAVDKKELVIKVVRLPEIDEVGLPVDVGIVVELLSR